MTVSLGLLVVTLLLRGVGMNRHVRGRLLGSAVVFAAHALASGATRYLALSPELQRQLQALLPLLLAFGIVNSVVALVINPWRADRLPDRFPKIVQDTFVIVLFAIAATLILQERIFATTAVGAVVIGFALQETLGNLFAGLAIQIEKPFQVGHWVRLAGNDGLVSEITWRATKIRTKTGNFVIVPNSALSRDAIVNYSEPSADTRVEIEVGASYDTPPNDVKATILAAIRDESLISPVRQPEVLIADFAASAITYRVRAWTSDFAVDEVLRDRLRSAVYYAFRRGGIEIPLPMQVEIHREERLEPAPGGDVLTAVDIFSSLDRAALADLGRAARTGLYAAGEVVVRQGEAGSSMFVIVRGEVEVTLEPSHQEVARLSRGAFFGEMSLLTGSPRAATVKAVTDAELLEITVETFRRFVLANPAAVEQVSAAVATRAAELHQRRSAEGPSAPAEPPHTFLATVRRFLRM